MSESDSGDRTLPPTERRRRAARLRGEVARSSQLTSAFVLLAASGFLWSMNQSLTGPCKTMLRTHLAAVRTTPLTIDSTVQLMNGLASQFVSGILLLVLPLVLSGLVANLFQIGWLWVPTIVIPRLRRRELPLGTRLVDATAFLLKIMICAGIGWRYLMTHAWQLRSLSLIEPGGMLFQTIRMASEFCFQLSAGLVLLGLADYGYRFWRHEQSLKMTADEIRREQREDSVNPEIRKQQVGVGRPGDRLVTLSEVHSVGAVRN